MDPIIVTRSLMFFLWGSVEGLVSISLIVTAILMFIACVVTLLRDSDKTGSVLSATSATFMVICSGFILATADRSAVDDDAVAAAVSERYAMETITPVGHADPEEICQSVSPDSPEYAGVTDGQEISFRVGFADCEDPSTVQIITTAPGIAPSDLEH